MKKVSTVIFILLAVSIGCEKEKESSKYADPSMWLCKPDLEHNYCYDDLTATEIMPDGSMVERTHTLAQEPEFDCFYIYPTVDFTGPIGNHTDFSDVTPMLVPLMNQAARFTEICDVYAPLYRQVTIATFAVPDNEEYLEIAYSDVEEAFNYYIRHYNRNRPFVLMGHSQGSMMLRALMQRVLENNKELLDKMITALLIGGDVLVPAGKRVGETFKIIPTCASVEDTGCVIAYRSYSEDRPPTIEWPTGFPAGTEPACFNPANPDNPEIESYLQGAYFPVYVDFAGIKMTLMENVSTPFFLYSRFFTAHCAKTETGNTYLAIGYSPLPGDQRTLPIPPENVPLYDVAGLHILDYNLALRDLIEVVRKKAARFLVND